MIDILIILAVLLVVGGASLYIWRAKKRGQKCIGCPYAGRMGKNGCRCNKL